MDSITEQMKRLQMEIQENRSLLDESYEDTSRQELKDTIECKEKQLAEFQLQLEGNELTKQRRSERPKAPTEKMLALQKEDLSKREKRLFSAYEQFKNLLRTSRENLKDDISEDDLTAMAELIERRKDNILRDYDEVRAHGTTSTELRRKIDGCEAATKAIMQIIYERMTEVHGDFDAQRDKQSLHRLLIPTYAHSIYGTASLSGSNLSNPESVISVKRVEAAAELAASEAKYKLMEEEIKQREKIRILEEQHSKELEMQRAQLERLQVERDIEVARAKLEVYDREIEQTTDRLPIQQSITQGLANPPMQNRNPSSHPVRNRNPSTVNPLPVNNTSTPTTDIYYLAQAVQDSIATNRLPTPEPTVFSGDPILFIEWKASFMSLIDRKAISAADKLYYLKKYVTGSAHQCLEGTFYRNDDEAYRDAWNKLNKRYGQPFVVQRAFRDKLARWPKIQSKDVEGLRSFADFLNACLQAMPHVRGLEILSDCEENQKLLQKVPEWVAALWNRQVSEALMEGKDFPTFKEFSTFIARESEIACNPVTSLHALQSSDSFNEKRITKEINGNKAHVFNTQTAVNIDNEKTVNNGNPSPPSPCTCCKDNNHQLHNCSEFMKKSMDDRRMYVRENGLCYGCVSPGHNAKECRQRSTCDLCMGRHPTCLHVENYRKVENKERHVPTPTTSSSTSNENTVAMALNVTRVGESHNTSMIVPVWVSSVKNPLNEELVYALLDTQSDSTFIDKDVSNKLQADTDHVKLNLTTMLEENTIMECDKVYGLRVRGYTSSVYIDLPPSYTKDCIPVKRDHIPTHNTAKQWPHLKEITGEIPPLLSCDAGLLIGYDCPRTLVPRQVIAGKDNEPFAIKTDLGWSVVGCSNPHPDDAASSLCHRIIVKELPPVTAMDVMSTRESDCKDTKGDVCTQEGVIALCAVKDGIRKTDQGHNETPSSFKQRPHSPDNERIAEVSHIQRKFYKECTVPTYPCPSKREKSTSKNAIPVLPIGDPKVKRTLTKKTEMAEPVSKQEHTERVLVKDLQSQALEKESLLKFNKGEQVPWCTKPHHVDLLLDTGGTLKVGGRPLQASLHYSFKHPKVIPMNSPDNLQPLTPKPNHLIHRTFTTAQPSPGTFTRKDLYTTKGWHWLRYLTELTCRKCEYMDIIARQQWHSPVTISRKLEIGDKRLKKAFG